MNVAPTIKIGMPLAEYLAAFAEKPFELIDGERIDWMPNVATPNWIMRFIYNFLWAYGDKTTLGEAFFEMTYILPDTYTSNWVTDSLTPDVMFIKATRLTEYRQNTPNWGSMPYAIIPDLVVEVISPNDRYEVVSAKIDRYQTDGVALIWIVNPKTRTIKIYTPDRTQIAVLSAEDTLTGGDILPDFALPVADMFNP
jgi:Uma2 family endonuclease